METFQMRLKCQLQNTHELVFNILVINVKVPTHHIST